MKCRERLRLCHPMRRVAAGKHDFRRRREVGQKDPLELPRQRRILTRTLILTDLVFNLTNYPSWRDRLFWRMSGVPRALGLSRTERLLLLRDREASSRTLRRAFEWPFERVVMAHGEIVEERARERLGEVYAEWLRPALDQQGR